MRIEISILFIRLAFSVLFVFFSVFTAINSHGIWFWFCCLFEKISSFGLFAFRMQFHFETGIKLLSIYPICLWRFCFFFIIHCYSQTLCWSFHCHFKKKHVMHTHAYRAFDPVFNLFTHIIASLLIWLCLKRNFFLKFRPLLFCWCRMKNINFAKQKIWISSYRLMGARARYPNALSVLLICMEIVRRMTREEKHHQQLNIHGVV